MGGAPAELVGPPFAQTHESGVVVYGKGTRAPLTDVAADDTQASGVGYGLLMSRPNVLPVSVEGRPIAVRPLDPPATSTHVVAIWPEDMILTSRAVALLDFAVEKLGG